MCLYYWVCRVVLTASFACTRDRSFLPVMADVKDGPQTPPLANGGSAQPSLFYQVDEQTLVRSPMTVKHNAMTVMASPASFREFISETLEALRIVDSVRGVCEAGCGLLAFI